MPYGSTLLPKWTLECPHCSLKLYAPSHTSAQDCQFHWKHGNVFFCLSLSLSHRAKLWSYSCISKNLSWKQCGVCVQLFVFPRVCVLVWGCPWINSTPFKTSPIIYQHMAASKNMTFRLCAHAGAKCARKTHITWTCCLSLTCTNMIQERTVLHRTCLPRSQVRDWSDCWHRLYL